MCFSIIIKSIINQLIRVKHIIIYLSKCRVFRRYRIYLLMSSIILLIQLILAITFYSSYNLSLESKIHNKFPVKEKSKKLNEQNHESVEYEIENYNSMNYAIDNRSKDLTQILDHKKILNLNELKINAFCNISGKYAVSAIRRASTNKCKQELADITCLSQSSQLYPKSLPRYCPLNDGNFGDYVGCYRDRAKARLLTGYRTKFVENNPIKCLNVCLQSGFRFAGLQFKNECFCGAEPPPHSSKLESLNCNMSCSGSPNHLCGGYFAIDIYRTGLSNMPKVIPSLVSHTMSENSIRIVFLLTVNGRSLRQIKRLINNLYDRKHFYYIHVDSRQDYLFRELSQLESKFENIKLSRVRLSTIWGGASLLRVLLNCISDILQMPEMANSWDFVINISETDFPIKPINEFENFLAANKAKNFVKSHGQDSQRFITKQGLDKTFYECDTHMWRVADRELPTGIRWDGGSDWVVLSHEFCKYITFNDNELLKGLKQVFKYTLLPAESYFHTVLQNSEYCSTIIDNNLRLTNWRRKQGCKCQYKHIVDWCGCSPNDFKTSDWSRLVATQSKPLFFGRKFEPVVNQAVINRIEESISKKSNENRVANDKYWQNEYHFKDTQPIIDDIKHTFYHSFAINTLKSIEDKCKLKENLSPNNSHKSHEKQLQLIRVNEANLLFESDIFQGILISFESIAGDQINSRLSFETIVRPLTHVIFHGSNSLTEKLLTLQVCSDFDVKELIFRNFGCILGPFSKPVALHKWIPSSETFSTTFVWIDPINTVAGSYRVKIESNASTDQSLNVMIQKPLLDVPLRPGVWKLQVLHNWQIIAETRFLISPLFFYNKTQVNKSYAKVLHNGPKENYSSHNFSSIENFLGYKNKSLEIQKALKNGRKFGKDLLNWINSLYLEFWYSHDMCYISQHSTSLTINLNCDFHLIPCRLADWSSYSPDPKSHISLISSFK